jgi:hypothetical protein
VPYTYRRFSMLIEPAIYLNALLRDYFAAGGKIVVREFAEARELMSLRENLIFNCTGLGAQTLFHDEELIPIRGQLSFLLPQPGVDYMTLGPGTSTCFRGETASCSAEAMSEAIRAWSQIRRRASASCGRTARYSPGCVSGLSRRTLEHAQTAC